MCQYLLEWTDKNYKKISKYIRSISRDSNQAPLESGRSPDQNKVTTDLTQGTCWRSYADSSGIGHYYFRLWYGFKQVSKAPAGVEGLENDLNLGHQPRQKKCCARGS
jgi:hypothetical protein